MCVFGVHARSHVSAVVFVFVFLFVFMFVSVSVVFVFVSSRYALRCMACHVCATQMSPVSERYWCQPAPFKTPPVPSHVAALVGKPAGSKHTRMAMAKSRRGVGRQLPAWRRIVPWASAGSLLQGNAQKIEMLKNSAAHTAVLTS